jgi:hypothetical protein
LDLMWWRWPCSFKCELEMADDLIDGLRIFDESDNLHFASTRRAQQRIELVDLARCLIEEKPLQTQQRPDHVLADSLCLSLGLSSDLAVNVEACVAPAEDFLHKGKANELLPKKQREDLMGKDLHGI